MAPPSPAPRALEYVALDAIAQVSTFRLRQPGDVSALAQSLAQLGQLFPVELRRRGDALEPVTGFRRIAALRLLRRDRVLARVHEELDDAGAALLAAVDAIDSRPLEREELTELRDRYRGMGWSTPALEELLARAIQKADEHALDLAAQVRGEAPPDRRAIDEDDLEDFEEEVVAAPPAEAPVAAPLGRPRQSFPMHSPGSDAAAAASLAARAAEVGQEPPEREVTADELAEEIAYRLSEITQDLAALSDAWSDVPELLRGIISDQLRYYSELGAWLGEHAEEE